VFSWLLQEPMTAHHADAIFGAMAEERVLIRRRGRPRKLAVNSRDTHCRVPI